MGFVFFSASNFSSLASRSANELSLACKEVSLSLLRRSISVALFSLLIMARTWGEIFSGAFSAWGEGEVLRLVSPNCFPGSFATGVVSACAILGFPYGVG